MSCPIFPRIVMSRTFGWLAAVFTPRHCLRRKQGHIFLLDCSAIGDRHDIRQVRFSDLFTGACRARPASEIASRGLLCLGECSSHPVEKQEFP